VPFFAGDDGLCGPVALATVLATTGVDASPTALAREVVLPGRGGALQPEMLAAIRRAERLPVTLDRGVEDLLAALHAGHPVLILQNLGTSRWPSWHYAVVVGYLRERDAFVLRSGSESRRLTGRRLLLRTWRRADYWAAVALLPGTLPAFVTAPAYRQAAVGLESAGRVVAAERAYRAGLARWPDDSILHLGLGNVLSTQGRHREALAAYQKLMAARPDDAVVTNNIALSLAQLGCRGRALALLEAALGRMPKDHRWRSALLSSHEEIHNADGTATEPGCPFLSDPPL